METVELEAITKTARSAFDCGNKQLNDFLKTKAGQQSRLDVAKTWVLLSGDSKIIGFYSLSTISIDCGELPENVRKRYPLYQFLPAALLGRLAVEKKHQGQRYGELLLMDAIHRTINASEELGVAFFIVDAKDSNVVNFYKKYKFEEVCGNPLKLWMAMGTLRKLNQQPNP